jgi:hypothetical protein
MLGKKPESWDRVLNGATKHPPCSDQSNSQTAGFPRGVHPAHSGPAGLDPLGDMSPTVSTTCWPASSSRCSPVTHHNQPFPLVLAEALASLGAGGHRGCWSERLLIVLGAIVLLQVPQGHLRTQRDPRHTKVHSGKEDEATCATMSRGHLRVWAQPLAPV